MKDVFKGKPILLLDHERHSFLHYRGLRCWNSKKFTGETSKVRKRFKKVSCNYTYIITRYDDLSCIKNYGDVRVLQGEIDQFSNYLEDALFDKWK